MEQSPDVGTGNMSEKSTGQAEPVANAVEDKTAPPPPDDTTTTATRKNEKQQEKEEQHTNFDNRFAELWEQIPKYTKDIEIWEGSEFYWPEKRTCTEKIIDELLHKRILLIKSVSEDWLYPAVQRLASVLQATGKLENVLLRITKRSLQHENSFKQNFNFGFWENQSSLPYPVVIFISADRHDFLHSLLSLSKETILSEIIPDLKKSNLYIVCEVDENITREEYVVKMKKRSSDLAVWEISCAMLQVTKVLGTNGQKLLNELENKWVTEKFDRRTLYEWVTRNVKPDTKITDNLLHDLENLGTDVEEKKQKLVDILQEDDFIKKIVIFCGAFFDGLYYPDFCKLVSALLLDERLETDHAKHVVGNDEISGAAAQPPLLSQVWIKQQSRILKSCFLETKKEGGNNRVGFVIAQLSENIARYIENEEYPLFFSIYNNFEAAGLLTQPTLSEKLEPYVIRFFATAARMDIASHNAYWLKNEVYRLWNLYATNLPKDKSYDELMRFLMREKTLAPIIFRRIPLIINDLLMSGGEHFKDIVKDFFKLLLNEANAKKMAVIIASFLYKERRYQEMFDENELISYFCRTLNEGDWEESFFAYDALSESMNYKDLWQQARQWINDSKIADKSWTKQFAFLYQLEYVMVTVYRYFRQFKADAVYELWDGCEEDEFPESFKAFARDLLNEKCLSSLNTLFKSEEGQERFEYIVELFERVESGRSLQVVERLMPPNKEAYTLIADVLEMWFYIMVHKEPDMKPGMDIKEKWKKYADMVNAHCDKLLFKNIRRYWANKIRFYTEEMIISKEANKNRQQNPSTNTYMENLIKRRSSLRILVLIILESRSKNIK